MAGGLSRTLRAGVAVGLVGELGSGKTVFVKGMVEGLGGSSTEVTSPTFALMNIYSTSPPVYHFDLFRLQTDSDLEAIGFWEFVHADGITVVEWADRVEAVLREMDILVYLNRGQQECERTLVIGFVGTW